MSQPEDYLDIMPHNEDEYLKTRVSDQIKWYDRKSISNKRWFMRFKILEIFLALLVPFLSGYITDENVPLKIIVGVLGVLVAAIAGLVTLVKYQENWIEERSMTESLKEEKFLFLAKAGPYKGVDAPFELFVERFESLISNSTKKWTTFIKSERSN